MFFSAFYFPSLGLICSAYIISAYGPHVAAFEEQKSFLRVKST